MSRKVANDAMDVHGGKGICMGPKNYLARGYQVVPVAIEGLSQHLCGLFANLLFGDAPDIERNPPQQAVLEVRMEMHFELGPVDVLATDDEIVEGPLFLTLSEILSNILEMPDDFVIDAAFGTARVVSRETISSAAAWQGVNHRLSFPDFIEMEIEDAGLTAVHKSQT